MGEEIEDNEEDEVVARAEEEKEVMRYHSIYSSGFQNSSQ